MHICMYRSAFKKGEVEGECKTLDQAHTVNLNKQDISINVEMNSVWKVQNHTVQHSFIKGGGDSLHP